jgi:hypothetical protein
VSGSEGKNLFYNNPQKETMETAVVTDTLLALAV